MAYARTNLSGGIGGGSNAPKFYTFRDTASTKAQIATADYFLDLNDILDIGDGIYAQGSDGAVLLAVTASTSVTVTVEEAALA
jgi:hypothetical protein